MDVRSADVLTRTARSIRSDEVRSLLLAGAGALLVARLWPVGGVEDGPVLCPFRLLTGLPCPGCGLTRSWVYLVNGRLGDSVAANPFGLVLVAALAGLAAFWLVRRVRGRPPVTITQLAANRRLRVSAIVVIATWIGFAVVRAVTVAL